MIVSYCWNFYRVSPAAVLTLDSSIDSEVAQSHSFCCWRPLSLPLCWAENYSALQSFRPIFFVWSADQAMGLRDGWCVGSMELTAFYIKYAKLLGALTVLLANPFLLLGSFSHMYVWDLSSLGRSLSIDFHFYIYCTCSLSGSLIGQNCCFTQVDENLNLWVVYLRK